jgi:hypothetical protein
VRERDVSYGRTMVLYYLGGPLDLMKQAIQQPPVRDTIEVMEPGPIVIEPGAVFISRRAYEAKKHRYIVRKVTPLVFIAIYEEMTWP